MAEVGWASLGIVPTFDRNFDRDLARGVGPAADRVGRDSGRRFGLSFGKVATTAAAGVLGAGFAAFRLGKDAIGEASDLNESLNAVNVTYESNARAVKRLGRESAEALGLSNSEFNGLAVRFSAFAKTVGGEKRVAQTLDELTTRASDFASVMNLDVAEAASLFQSGLAGETEPLRQYGLDLSAAAVNAYAYAAGIAKQGEELTESEKVQARYGLLMRDTAKTSGDFANTSDALANRQRILNARWDDAQAKLGTALLPALEDVVGLVLDDGLPAFERFSDWFTTKGIPALQDFYDDARPIVDKALPELAEVLGTTRDVLSDAVPLAMDLVQAFNDMPDWAKKALVGGGLVLGVGAKTRGVLGGGGAGGGGPLSILGGQRGATPANPLFVTDVGLPDGDGRRRRGPGGVPLFPSLLGATLGLPLMLGGDSAPGQTVKNNSDENRALVALFEKTGTSSDEALVAALKELSREEQIELRRTLQEEFGLGFNRLSQVEDVNGNRTLAGLGSLTAGGQRASRNLYRGVFEAETEGVPQVLRQFLKLQDGADRLREPIRPELALIGGGRVRRELSDLERMAAQTAEGISNAVNNALSALGLNGGESTNYYGPVTYTDEEQGRRRASQRGRRAGSDGVRRP